MKHISLLTLALRLVAVIFVGTIFFRTVEGWSWVDAYFFTVVTISTVGYGDPTPVTDLGKIGSTILIFVGLGVFALAIQQIAAEQLAQSDEHPGRLHRALQRWNRARRDRQDPGHDHARADHLHHDAHHHAPGAHDPAHHGPAAHGGHGPAPDPAQGGRRATARPVHDGHPGATAQPQASAASPPGHGGQTAAEPAHDSRDPAAPGPDPAAPRSRSQVGDHDVNTARRDPDKD
ncbi:potassium channel family protein [Marinibacterium sp. SX1]|uniref:potassium channel family protein n=1 Tax=Marinibacterium sp. SX1 TaxID=3388424 RepID=UPI003D167CBB